jgi:hypothetical protein
MTRANRVLQHDVIVREQGEIRERVEKKGNPNGSGTGAIP